MDFQEYCKKKKIDTTAFKSSEPGRFDEFEMIFNQVHPDSFTQQKKFLINDLRRKYPLKEEVASQDKAAVSPVSPNKPAIKIGPKIK